jgi:xylan 1,4-beta-xylosidase
MKNIVFFVTALLLGIGLVAPALSQTSVEQLTLNATAPAHPFPHFWEQMFGSGRAILSLRDSYRHDLDAVRGITGFHYVRFHAILDDDVGVYDEISGGAPQYNFSYVDQIYDGLLDRGVRPFVELSFMPNKLAAASMPHAFWYKPNVSPPRDYGKWDTLIAQLAQHLVDRYGIDEVSQWYFEVWNEPDLDFWGGDPRQATYFELYDHTARALKAVNSRLRVGGPATAQAAWAPAFLSHCAENHIAVDFVSSHVYGDDTAHDVFGTDEDIPRNQMVCRAIRKVHDQILASATPSLPLVWSEFNASYKTLPDVTDGVYMGPWLADTIRQCDGLVEMMSYWTFSDVFEEQGVVKQPFYGGYGLIAEGGVPKPAFNAFQILHALGDQRIELASDHALLTRRTDGKLVLAIWNYAQPGEAGHPESIEMQIQGKKVKHALVSRVDAEHGDFHPAYAKLGSPVYPTQNQFAQLRAAVRLSAPERIKVHKQTLTVTLPAHGLAVIEMQ